MTEENRKAAKAALSFAHQAVSDLREITCSLELNLETFRPFTPDEELALLNGANNKLRESASIVFAILSKLSR